MLYLGEISAVITAVLWSFTSIFFSKAALKTGSVQLNINRLIIATVLLMAVILIGGIDYRVTQTQVFSLIISGVIGLVLGDAFLFKAYVLIGPRFAILLMALSPGLSSVLSYFFLGEVLMPFAIAGIILTLTGIAITGSGSQQKETSRFQLSFMGILFGFLAALGQAGGLIFAKIAFNISPINGFVATFIRVCSSAVIMLPVLLLLKKYKNPVVLYTGNRSSLLYTLAGSITGPFLGITFSLIAVANTKVGVAATLMSTMPVLMIPLMWFFYKEKPTLRGVLGTIIAVIGVALLFLK